MTMLHPTNVLPSNAPPLSQNRDSGHVSRVLQEYSGNRQNIEYPHQYVPEQKYAPPSFSENIYNNPVQRRAHLSHQAPRRHGYGYVQSEDYLSPEEIARIEKQAMFLLRRFESSDEYAKYRTRQSRSEGKNQQEAKWPDHLEYAFFEALVRWSPMGRRQVFWKEKQRGRNELIADYIECRTGMKRNRKQVSSHIQVLKPFVRADPYIMKYLSKNDSSGHDTRYFQARHTGRYVSGRRMSSYPVVPPLYGGNQPPALNMSNVDSVELAKYKGLLEIFEPVDFQMFVQRKHNDQNIDRLHTYTASTTRPCQPDSQIQDWVAFQQEYPLLANMNMRTPLDCSVLLAEASIAFPAETFAKDKDKVELGISFLCNSKYIPPSARVSCRNTFYRNGHNEFAAVDQVLLTPTKDGVETHVKFGSTFWAKTLGNLALRLRDSNGEGSQGQNRSSREEVASDIKGIAASQEIFIETPQCRERLRVIYWKFRLSNGERGRAYWSQLRLPFATTSTAGAEYGIDSQPRTERVDSVFDYLQQPGQPYSSEGAYNLSQRQQSQPTALQSPFEYDNNSSSSELHSAAPTGTWPGHHDDPNTTALQSAIDPCPPTHEMKNNSNDFDFDGENINILYDLDGVDFSNFDSAAFCFDASTELATDPALAEYGGAAAAATGAGGSQDFSEQTYDWDGTYDFEQSSQPQSQQPYPDIPGAVRAESQQQQQQQQHNSPPPSGYVDHVHQHDLGGATSEPEPFDFNAPLATTTLASGHHLAHMSWEPYPISSSRSNNHHHHHQHHDPSSSSSWPPQQGEPGHEAQAYGGAGSNVKAEGEGQGDAMALVALADATSWAQQPVTEVDMIGIVEGATTGPAWEEGHDEEGAMGI